MIRAVGELSAQSACILLAPNQSLSLVGNIWVFVSLVAASFGISVVFALAGAWMVLPFVLLEMLVLGTLFGYVYLEGTRREMIRISERSVTLQRFRGGRQQLAYHREFLRTSLSVRVYMSHSEPAKVNFSGPEGCLEVGEFLTDGEKAILIRKLGACGLCARREPQFESQSF